MELWKYRAFCLETLMYIACLGQISSSNTRESGE